METLDDYCYYHDWESVTLALSLTYAPLCIYLVKWTRGNLAGFLNFLIFVMAFLVFYFLVKTSFGSANDVFSYTVLGLTLGFWGLYSLVKFVIFLVTRCRLCLLGRRYILAPPNSVEFDGKFHAFTPTGSTAYVVRKPGLTSVNGTLVPGLKQIIVGGRKAAKKGLVTLRRYAK